MWRRRPRHRSRYPGARKCNPRPFTPSEARIDTPANLARSECPRLRLQCYQSPAGITPSPKRRSHRRGWHCSRTDTPPPRPASSVVSSPLASIQSKSRHTDARIGCEPTLVPPRPVLPTVADAGHAPDSARTRWERTDRWLGTVTVGWEPANLADSFDDPPWVMTLRMYRGRLTVVLTGFMLLSAVTLPFLGWSLTYR